MSHTLPDILAFTLVTLGVLAEIHLIRLFIREWRSHQRPRPLRATRAHSSRPPHPRTSAASRSRRILPVALTVSVGAAVAAPLAIAQSTPPSTPSPAQPAAAAPAAPDSLTLEPIPPQPSSAPPTEPPAPFPLTISTDRPGFSDTAGIAPLGHLTLETGYTFTFRNRDDVETHRHNAPELLARVGLLDDRLELRLSTSGYVWSRSDDGDGFLAAEGFSDAALGFKLKLTDQDGALPRLAFEAVTSLGVGSRGISSRHLEPTIKLIWAYNLEQLVGDRFKGLSLYGNLNLACPTTDGDRFLQGAASVAVAYALSPTVSLFAEYYVVGPASKGDDAAHAIDFGGAYLLNNRVQLDARVGFGLNDTADNFLVAVGISFLF